MTDHTFITQNGVLTAYTGRETCVTVPADVTVIGANAFANQHHLQEIVIPGSVRHIDEWAFKGCDRLHSVTLGDGVERIGDGCFFKCRSLRTLRLPDSVSAIGNWAFRECESLSRIRVPSALRVIGNGAFFGCKRLTVPSLSAAVSVGGQAFDGCAVLQSGDRAAAFCARAQADGYQVDSHGTLIGYTGTDTVLRIPDGVVHIGRFALSGNRRLTEVVFPDSVRTVGENAFAHCFALRLVRISKSVTHIGAQAFANCYALEAFSVSPDNTRYCEEHGVLFDKAKTVLLQYPCAARRKSYRIPADVKTVGRSAFADLQHLLSVTVPDGVRKIDDRAFFNSKCLREVTVPNSVDAIGTEVFSHGSPRLVLVCAKDSPAYRYAVSNGMTPKEANADEVEEDTFLLGGLRKALSFGSDARSPDSACVEPLTDDADVADDIRKMLADMNTLAASARILPADEPIGDGLRLIPTDGNIGKTRVTPIADEETGDALGTAADAGVAVSKEADGERSSDTAVPKAMDKGTAVEPIRHLDQNGMLIKDGVLMRYSGKAAHVAVPEGVTAIREYAFKGCRKVKTVSFPSTLKTIEKFAFADAGLMQAVIPEGVTKLGGGAFFGCRKLETVIVHEGITALRDGTFAYCPLLTNVSVPSTVTTVETAAFRNSRQVCISAPKGSAAHAFAVRFRIAVRAV